MTKAFVERIKKEGMVDTKNYRYRFIVEPGNVRIVRIEISKLDTTAAYSDWEVVKEF